MSNHQIKQFIEDYENSKSHKFTKYLLRGEFKKGFQLFISTPPDFEWYYFTLDDDDIKYLVDKYKVKYEKILEDERVKDRKEIEDKIKELQSKLKKL